MSAFLFGHMLHGLMLVTVLLMTPVSGEAAQLKTPEAKPEPVSAEEYAIFARVIETKFLTSQTETVLIGRLTVTKLGPNDQDVPSRAYFSGRQLFAGLMAPELATDFILRNGRPSRLEPRFTLAVRYRFVSGDGLVEEPEVSLAPIPALFQSTRPVQGAPPTVGVLKFARVGFAQRRDQALVYVEEERQDGTGAGMMMLLQWTSGGWEFLDTEVLWIARREE
jgi:hypothetical protein